MEALALFAGAVVTTAAIPRVADILRNADRARGESFWRNTLLIAGNLLWVAYGLLSSSFAITAMCSLNSLLNGAILWAAIHANSTRE
jgi:uncharacterized protein with PQ loop repeat